MPNRFGFLVNPPGYFVPLEQGAAVRWTGAEMFQRGWLTQAQGMWLAPNSEWVMNRPRNFDADWPKSTGTGAVKDHTLDLAKWSFNSNVVPAALNLSRTVNEYYADDAWMNFGSIPNAIGGEPINVNFTSLFAAAQVVQPTKLMRVIADLPGMFGNMFPYIRFVYFPEPESVICFGFGDLCILVTGRGAYLLKSTDNHQTWRLLGSNGQRYGPNTPGRGDGGISVQSGSAGTFASYSPQTSSLNVGVIPVGWNSIYMMPRLDVDPWIVTTRSPPTAAELATAPPQPIGDGPWWIAAYGGQKVICQVQTMAFADIATYTPVSPIPINQEWINLQSSYTPNAAPPNSVVGSHDGTVGPFLAFQGLLVGLGTESVTVTPGGLDVIASDSKAEISAQLQDETATNWSSNGTHFRGGVKIRLKSSYYPGDMPPVPPFQYSSCPAQFREIQLVFPTILQSIGGSPLLLDDTMYMPDWRGSASLNDPDSKQFEIPLTTLGAQAMKDAGYADRHDIPIELREDTARNGTYIRARARGWIVEPPDDTELTAAAGPWTTNLLAHPKCHSLLHCRGMLARMQTEWVYANLILDAANLGKLAHDEAVKQAILQSGINTADPEAAFLADDSTTPDDIRMLPGGMWDQVTNAAEQQHASAYAPEIDGTMLEYAKKIAQEWRGWLFYEDLLGRVWYRDDPFNRILDFGQTPVTDAILYRSHAEAVGAGEGPQQYYRDLSELTVKPLIANRIRCIPARVGLGEDVRQYLFTDPRYNDPNYENFLGHIRTKVLHQKDMVKVEAINQGGIVALRRFSRKQRTRRVKMFQAPWQVTQGGVVVNGGRGADVGSILQLAGHETVRVVHLEVEQHGPAVFETTYTGEKLPLVPPVFQ